MAIKYNNVNTVWQGAAWLKLGWKLFKQQPLTWVLMTLILIVFSGIVGSLPMGQFVVALLSPVFIGGIYLSMHKTMAGEKVHIEGFFSAFKHQFVFKQLLLIGVIGAVVMGLDILIENMPGSGYMMQTGSSSSISRQPVSLGSTLQRLINIPWAMAVVFAIPLVAIKQHRAIPALKNSLWVGVMHLISIIPFLLMVCVLVVVAVLPAGLGLLVLLPVLLCSLYSAFAMIYPSLEPIAEGAISTKPAELEDKHEPDQPVAQTLSASGSLTAHEHIQQSIAKQQEAVKHRVERPANDIDLPKSLSIEYFDNYICITRYWPRARGILAIVLSLLSVAVNYYIFSGKIDPSKLNGEQWFINFLPWVFPIVALISGYVGLAMALNRTNIYVGEDTIEIRHMPLPWLGNKRVEAKNIKQVYVQEEERVVNQQSGRTRRYYHLNIMPLTGASYSLLRSLDSSKQAQYIEQEIEKFLNIQDEVISEVLL